MSKTIRTRRTPSSARPFLFNGLRCVSRNVARASTLALAMLCVLFAANAKAAETVYVGKKAARGISMNDIDHSSWNQLLMKYVNNDGLVNYQRWKNSRPDVVLLDRYLSHLSDASRRAAATRASRLAFWINAYNAVTIRGILREYPTTSIRNHTAKLWGYNIWDDLQLYVGRQPTSLNQMEHEILRKMGEPRIHFAIVCASIGCPRLLNAAYRSDALETQLETNSKDFFSRRQNFQYDTNRKHFYLSSILDWFGEDFGSNQSAKLRRIAGWLPTPAAAEAAKRSAVTVSYLDYNWNLNKQ